VKSSPRADTAPAVQASYMKNLFATLAKLDQLAAVEAADPDLVQEVDAASRLSWLPVSLNVRTVEAMAARFGEQRGIELLAECVYRQFDTPLWKSFVGGAMRLLGTDPGLLGRFLPEAIQLVFRGCGQWSVESTGETELTVHARELPASLVAHGPWLRSLATGMTPLFTLCSCGGSARLAEADEAARSARYVLTWKPAA
jgi:hypothetical protein